VANEKNWKSGVHRTQWSQSLRDYVSPVLGRLLVESIATEHVLAVLEPLWAKFPETASRCRGRIEAVLDFAKFTLKFTGATAATRRAGPAILSISPSSPAN
jgi:hypothetical protein